MFFVVPMGVHPCRISFFLREECPVEKPPEKCEKWFVIRRVVEEPDPPRTSLGEQILVLLICRNCPLEMNVVSLFFHSGLLCYLSHAVRCNA